MSHRTAAWLVTGTHHLAERVRRADAEQGQGTVEYAGLAMAIGVLLLAVGSYLGGKDHGIGAVVTDAIKTAVEHATGDFMVILDADLEYDPNDIPRLLQPVLDGHATVVYGNRTFGSHSSFSFWYVMGNKAVTTADRKSVV